MLKKLQIIFLLFATGISLNSVCVQAQRKGKVNDTTYMLTYDHGGLILWGSDHFRERLKNATEWLDKYPSFKIGLDNEAQIYDYFAGSEPAMLDELNGLLKKYRGRLGIGSCTYGQPLSQFINDESNIRQIGYALKAEIKYLNYRPPVYIMSEHAMHSQIPQILNGFGFEGAIMRTHFMMYGYNPVFDVPIGWWVGLDGSRIPAVPTYPGEGAAFGKTTMDTWILTRYPSRESPEPMEAFRKKFRHINPLLATRADDSGLRREELVKEYEKKPKFRWILLDELLKKYPEPVKDMATKPDDFTVRMPWGYCGNEIWNMSREAEVSVLTAERLAAMEYLSGGASHENDLDISWKNLLLAQHHDIQICGLLPESRRLLPVSTERSEKVINEAMTFFAGNMHGEGIKQVTVFNPLSWKRSAWIYADIAPSRGSFSHFVAKCGNKEIPVRIISANRRSDGSIYNARIAFKAELEPLNFMSFSVIPSEKPIQSETEKISYDEKSRIVKTPFYEITLSENGGINNITDVETGKIITAGKERALFFEGRIDGVVCQSSGKWVVGRTGENAPWLKLSEYGFISSIPYQFEVTLYEDNPRIDCKVRFDFNGQKTGLLSSDERDSHSPFVHEEKLRFKFFPSTDTSATGVRDLPFAISGTRNRYIEGNYWTALADGKSGVAFFNKGTMGSIHEKDNSFSIPLAYSMYYVWGTRILYGPFGYEFSILPFRGDWKDADLHRKALDYSFIPPVFESIPHEGKAGDNLSPVETKSDDDVIMTALYPENGKVTARFFKSGDQTVSSSFNLEVDGKKFSETKADGRFIRDIEGKISLKPWEFKTISIQNK